MKNIGDIKNKNINALLNSSNIYYEGGGTTLDKILYPIGSIYMSVNSTNPSQLFGGTWTQISGRFLYCTTTSKTTGGSSTTGSTTLTVNQIPSHSHLIGKQTTGISASSGSTSATIWWDSNSGVASTSVGGGQGHTHSQNLPPYFTVYCWYRVS